METNTGISNNAFSIPGRTVFTVLRLPTLGVNIRANSSVLYRPVTALFSSAPHWDLRTTNIGITRERCQTTFLLTGLIYVIRPSVNVFHEDTGTASLSITLKVKKTVRFTHPKIAFHESRHQWAEVGRISDFRHLTLAKIIRQNWVKNFSSYEAQICASVKDAKRPGAYSMNLIQLRLISSSSFFYKPGLFLYLKTVKFLDEVHPAALWKSF